MGVDIIVKGVRYDKNDGSGAYKPVVSDGLVGAFFTNKTLRKCSRNFATSGAFEKIVGNPTVDDASVKFKGNVNFMLTSIKESDEMTFFVVAKTTESMSSASNANAPYFCGTFDSLNADGTVNNGVSLFFDATSRTLRVGVAYFDSSAVKFMNAALKQNQNDNVFRLYKAKIKKTEVSITDVTSNITTTTQVQNLVRATSKGQFRIGSASRTWGGECDIAAVMIYEKATSDDEDLLIQTSISNYMKSLNISV